MTAPAQTASTPSQPAAIPAMAAHYLTNPRPPSKGSTMIDDVMLEAEDSIG